MHCQTEECLLFKEEKVPFNAGKQKKLEVGKKRERCATHLSQHGIGFSNIS